MPQACPSGMRQVICISRTGLPGLVIMCGSPPAVTPGPQALPPSGYPGQEPAQQAHKWFPPLSEPQDACSSMYLLLVL